MNFCKTNLVDFGNFTRVVHPLLSELTIVRVCMRHNPGVHLESGFRESIVSRGKCIFVLSNAFRSCSFQL